MPIKDKGGTSMATITGTNSGDTPIGGAGNNALADGEANTPTRERAAQRHGRR